jgi:hypothetical protein
MAVIVGEWVERKMEIQQLAEMRLQTGYVFENGRLSMKNWGMSARRHF